MVHRTVALVLEDFSSICVIKGRVRCIAQEHSEPIDFRGASHFNFLMLSVLFMHFGPGLSFHYRSKHEETAFLV